MTSSQPGSELELQLYRVLERANLLQYYDTFISQGGDDVRQLCEAGEEEFLEIMALVGMASKPLHVRRLQKALQEWVQSPVMFSQPLGTALPPTSAAPDSIIATMQQAAQYTCATPPPQKSQESSNQCWPEHNDHSPVGSSINGAMGQDSLSEYPMIISETSSKCTSLQEQGGSQSGLDRDTDSPELSNKLPVMLPHQIEALARAAEELARDLPMYEPKPLNIKKPRNKDILDVMNLPTDHPNRMELLRKYGAIYGRYDSKRKNEKYMSLHEMSVNEAASQLCSRRPTLLTRREDLFILARQVVRDSGYQYSKGHSRGQAVDIPPNKKARLEELLQRDATPRSSKAELEKSNREERMTEINRELTEITSQQTDLKKKISEASGGGNDGGATTQPLQDLLQNLTRRQLKLLTEQSDVIKRQQLVQKYQSSKDVSYSDNGNSRDEPDSDDSDLLTSEPTSPRESASGDAATSGKTTSVRKSLYDEGLRIAQQYGLEDLAQEIKVLQPAKLDGTGGQDITTSTPKVKQEGVVESKTSRAESSHYGEGSRGIHQFNVGDHSQAVRISQPSKLGESAGHGQSDFNLGIARIKQEGAAESKPDIGKAGQYGEALRVTQQYGLGSTAQLDGVGGSGQPHLIRLAHERTIEASGKPPKLQSLHLKSDNEMRNRHEIDNPLAGGTGRHGMDHSLGGATGRQDLESDEQREWNREVEHDLKILLKRNGHASDNFKIERNEVSS